MSAQPVHHGDGGPSPLPRTQNAVAAALPTADRTAFRREMGEADETELLSVLRRWWLWASLYATPLPDDVRTDTETGAAPGTPAGVALCQAAADGEACADER
ncbi:hypothetical protein [Streptomyces sp. NPDC059788]|uniref:hypothetical protein n=1 Tax=Streptomyces sp. NPDC059788 TaxID=3346948 RepID=UPI0036684B75